MRQDNVYRITDTNRDRTFASRRQQAFYRIAESAARDNCDTFRASAAGFVTGIQKVIFRERHKKNDLWREEKNVQLQFCCNSLRSLN